MRHLTADYIFTSVSPPLKNGIISVGDDGTINSVSPARGDLKTEYHKGAICPGFINTHCHLELSHFRSVITEKAGMTGFIKELLSRRAGFSSEEIRKGIEAAESEMIRNGVVAVGDISNDNSTFLQKSKGNLRYHTFLEVFDLNPDKAEEVFRNALALKSELSNYSGTDLKLTCSIIPHAPYTVSEKLFSLIKEESVKTNSILSIHNQESAGESELFQSHTGALFEAFSKMGLDMKNFPVSGLNSFRTIFPRLPLSQKILFVHNTFTSADDIKWAQEISDHKSSVINLFWCTCPNANLYIENRLPDYSVFIDSHAKVTIGTDSLASNHNLSVLDELKTISSHFPDISLETMLIWASKNGAEFLGFNELGTIEKGKKPGLNLLKNLKDLKLTEYTEVEKLI